ncbi:MAG: hypothetical protein NC831_02855 [Candidatus Omnitrophica bacterium]|nr:hypothetical protein [Candidatus Omnitrophota bacterium]MCM8828310.1 hypothetical protein [Candidatus Omnitrophota bacterium]
MENRVKIFLGPHNLTSERVEFLVREISGKHNNIEVKRYYGAEFNPEYFRDEVLENSLFIQYKILIVHQIEQIEKKVWAEYIIPYLEYVPDNVFVIFEGLSVKAKINNCDVEVAEDAEDLFRKIYKKSWQKKINAGDIYEISKFLKSKPYEFSIVIGVIGKHLENLVAQKIISEMEFIKRLETLLDLDFSLKSGRISNEPGWEILLLRLLGVESN